MATRQPTAAVVLIGNELLSGRTRDANLAFLGGRLAALGIRLCEARVVEDIQADIIRAVNDCRAQVDYVFTTGGIGPTHDDITTAAVARAFGVPVVRDPEAVHRMRAYYGAEHLTPARLRMADVPEGAALIDNPVSAAPGFRIGNVHVLAGVPSIMQAMFDAVSHTLTGGPPILARTVTAAIRESLIAAGLEAIQGRYPGLSLGSYPFARAAGIGTSVVVRGTDSDRIGSAAAEVRAMFEGLGATGIEDLDA